MNREEVALSFIPRIRTMAHRMARNLPSTIDVNDLVQAGIIGLMSALDAYDPSRSDRLAAYVERRIRGALLDELRALDPLSRDQRHDVREAQRAARALETRLGRRADDDEVAATAGLSTARLRELQALVDRTTCESLTDEHADRVGDAGAEDAFERLAVSELRARLVDAIDDLPERQRLVLSLLYVEELTLKEIGQVLGVSESRVCQIHGQAVDSLRASFGID
jgi:RNA polymerase sigma factor for flagellar operon FliA